MNRQEKQIEAISNCDYWISHHMTLVLGRFGDMIPRDRSMAQFWRWRRDSIQRALDTE